MYQKNYKRMQFRSEKSKASILHKYTHTYIIESNCNTQRLFAKIRLKKSESK